METHDSSAKDGKAKSMPQRRASKSFGDLLNLLPQKTKQLSISLKEKVKRALTPNSIQAKRDDAPIGGGGIHLTLLENPRVIPNDRKVLMTQVIQFGRSSELLRSLRRNLSVEESKQNLPFKYVVVTEYTIEFLDLDNGPKEQSNADVIVIDLDSVHGISLPYRTLKSSVDGDEVAIRTTEIVIHLGHRKKDLWLWCDDNEERACLLDVLTNAIQASRKISGDKNPLEIDQLSLEEVTERVVLGVRLEDTNTRIVRSNSRNSPRADGKTFKHPIAAHVTPLKSEHIEEKLTPKSMKILNMDAKEDFKVSGKKKNFHDQFLTYIQSGIQLKLIRFNDHLNTSALTHKTTKLENAVVLSLNSTFENDGGRYYFMYNSANLDTGGGNQLLGVFFLSEIKAVRPVEESDYIETQKALNSHEKRHLQLIIETLDESWIFETTGGTSMVRDKMIEGIQHVLRLDKAIRLRNRNDLKPKGGASEAAKVCPSLVVTDSGHTVCKYDQTKLPLQCLMHSYLTFYLRQW